MSLGAPFRMRFDIAITDKALGGLSIAERARIQSAVAQRMLAEGKRAMYEELGIKEPQMPAIEGDYAPALKDALVEFAPRPFALLPEHLP